VICLNFTDEIPRIVETANHRCWRVFAINKSCFCNHRVVHGFTLVAAAATSRRQINLKTQWYTIDPFVEKCPSIDKRNTFKVGSFIMTQNLGLFATTLSARQTDPIFCSDQNMCTLTGMGRCNLKLNAAGDRDAQSALCPASTQELL